MALGFTGRLFNFLRIGRKVEIRVAVPAQTPLHTRLPTDHVIMLDGTLATLMPGQETNVGMIYRLLRALPKSSGVSLYYEAGVQWHMWSDTAQVATGAGINRQIRRAYGWLASHYRPGDRIFLFGYSRGAFAVRSLAGVIDQIGLLRSDAATERNVRQAYRYYQNAELGAAGHAFGRAFCHERTEIEMIGVFDTVKALGVRLPFLWMWTEPQHEFHSHKLSSIVQHGYQALALDETRAVFAPIIWDTSAPREAEGNWRGRVEQVWFRGAHGDIGGQLGGFAAARPLSNIPLVWMLKKAVDCGLHLPENWQRDLPCDAAAPSVGTLRGWGKAFLLRARRQVGGDPSERIHPSACQTRRGRFWLKRQPKLAGQS